MPPFHLVITGAPASGKSECFELLRADARFRDLSFFPEIARLLLIDNPALRSDRGRFHREIYRRQLLQEDALDAGASFVTDRGTLDAWAFHPELLTELGTTRQREYGRYSHVILLESSATLGEEHYRIDDVRNESREDVLTIEAATRRIWREHPGYHEIAARRDVAAKYAEFVDLVERLYGRNDG